MPLRGGGRLRLRRPDCHCVAADAPAAQQMEGFRPLHDEQEGRFRTASLHPPAAPEITTMVIWRVFCRTSGSPQSHIHVP